MTETSEILALADRFFAAVERGDLTTVEAIYAPDAVIWHNTDREETGAAANLKVLSGFVRAIPKRRYEDRRVAAFDGGFVQQHVLKVERADGERFELPACVICQVKGGRITRLDEYFDSAQVAALTARAAT